MPIIGQSRGANSSASEPSTIDNSSYTGGRRSRVSDARGYRPQTSLGSASGNGINDLSCTISILPEPFSTSRSPIVGNQAIIQQSDFNDTSSPLESQSKQAGPLPEKVGEIGYIPPAQPMLNSNPRIRDPSTQSQVGFGSPSSPQTPQSLRVAPGWSPAPASVSPEYGNRHRRNNKPRGRTTASQMFLRPALLVFFGLIVIALTAIGFVEVQDRMSHKNSHSNSGSDDLDQDMRDGSGEADNNSSERRSTHNVSFVYMGTVFILALLIESWVFVSALRRLYHRLGLWVDQEYPIELPDLSDPEASPPSPPALPLWAKILGIKPQAVRPPLLPSYIAVLNVMRTGGRSEANPECTGDVEDGEVIRTLAIGQGHAAPAFNGEEFQKSTIILSGPPPKRNSSSSTTLPVPSNGLLRSLSRSLTGRFTNSRNPSPEPGMQARSATRNDTSHRNGRHQDSSRSVNNPNLVNREPRESLPNGTSTMMIELSEPSERQNPTWIHNSKRMPHLRQ